MHEYYHTQRAACLHAYLFSTELSTTGTYIPYTWDTVGMRRMHNAPERASVAIAREIKQPETVHSYYYNSHVVESQLTSPRLVTSVFVAVFWDHDQRCMDGHPI